MDPNTRNQGGDAPNSLANATPQPTPNPQNQHAATQVLRSQIDALYGDSPVVPESQPQAAASQNVNAQSPNIQRHVRTNPYATRMSSADTQYSNEDANPYERTYAPHLKPEAEQWKDYHSAWQTYYQKYYEAYYTQQTAQQEPIIDKNGFFSSANTLEPNVETEQAPTEKGELSRGDALFELKQNLLNKVRKQAGKVRKSRHFIPIASAVGVMLLFLFLQFNQIIIGSVSAYVSPGSIDAQNIVIDPSSTAVVGPEPRLIIPKINVDVPVAYDIGYDHDSQMKAMSKGVAHFAIPGANSHPGEVGNTVISGHSANDLFDQGDYKFVFSQLESKMQVGDTIYANYNGKRYTYVITKKEVVKPNEVNKLIYPTDKPVLTLITCTPLGTAEKRLLVTAEQISPDPSAASEAPSGSGESSGNASMPGNTPTLFERLFGAR